MEKTVYIPLDERPCNYNFPTQISKGTDYKLVVPPLEILGYKKRPADLKKLWNWLNDNITGCTSAILSIDMLLYGGIVPSRLHEFTFEECKKRLEEISLLKSKNKNLKIYAFNLIMRCPKYSSSDEEPDYYENYGEQIFKRKYIEHKIELNEATDEEINFFDSISIPKEVLSDFESRREINKKINIEILNLVKNNVIDFLVIPQDDSAPYGYTAKDQKDIRKEIRNSKIQTKALMYPGADEVGCTLLARCINESKNIKPKVKLHFPGAKSPFVIPLYEDRILIESIKYQILAAGGLVTDSDNSEIELFVNAPGSDMQEAFEQPAETKGYDIERNLTEFTEQILESLIRDKSAVAVADVAYANGGDIELFNLLKTKNILFKLAGYAGWNTSSNTLGTVICQSMVFNIYGNTQNHLDFLALRYIEDIGYCAIFRKYITDKILPDMGYNYFAVDGLKGKISEIVKEKLQSFADETGYKIKINECYMPWSRMFEVGLDVSLTPTTSK